MDLTRQELSELYQTQRRKTLELCLPLEIEDYVIQAMDDVSPPKWHLAHTTWFFETFVLMAELPEYQLFHPRFNYLFNSYYQKIGVPFPRASRGLLSRPTVEQVSAYRNYVDAEMLAFLSNQSDDTYFRVQPIIQLGLQHEQQHQELLLMDIKYNFSIDPDYPTYAQRTTSHPVKLSELSFIEVEGGLIEIGHQDAGFCFDNELPRHQQFIPSYKIANRLITNGEYLAFIMAKGYQRPEYWLADGWDLVKSRKWNAPLYWHQIENKQWYVFTLSGLSALNLDEPVVHVSYYEADAYARWRNARLPTESEWEHFVYHTKEELAGHFLEAMILHPRAAMHQESRQFFGDVWEWTSSPYLAYQGFKPLLGALGEYNGKFMCNQMVLRGGSCVTPQSHIRLSYRNFYQPDKRWHFGGIRLAEAM